MSALNIFRNAHLLAWFLAAAICAAGPKTATADAESAPANRIGPAVLNLALPAALVSADASAGKNRPEELERDIGRLFNGLYCPAGRCVENRALQINIALGNDYQILDWLGKGWVDAAAIPTLSLYLLRRDRVDLEEIALPSAGRAPSRSYELGKFWTSIWRRAELRRAGEKNKLNAAGCHLLLGSHLSTHDFLVPVVETSKWLEKQPGAAELANDFWQEFFDHVRLTIDGAAPESPPQPAECAPVIVDAQRPKGAFLERLTGADYRLVVNARRAKEMFSQGAGKLKRAEAALPEGLRKILEPQIKANEKERDRVPRAFRPLVFPEPYFGVRTFAFTIDESIELLRRQQRAKDDLLALVLPGGGVKAGFQSRLLEYLYENGKLKNYHQSRAVSATASEAKALHVDYIIGTSGGALLGFFIAQLGENGPWKFSKLLWERSGRILRSTDVFGFVDLPRYFSFLAVFGMLCLMLWGSLLMRRVQGGPPAGSAPLAVYKVWRVRLWLTIVPILVLLPFLVRAVNGQAAQEHIPEVAGYFYTVFVLIAMFADQCLVVVDTPQRELGWWRIAGGLAFLIGAVALVASVALRCQSPESPGFDAALCSPISSLHIQRGALLACLGALAVMIGAIFWTAASSRYHFADRRGFWSGVIVGLTHIFLVYFAFWIVMTYFPDKLSFLELTAEFWFWLLIIGLVVTVLFFLWISYRSFRPQLFRDGIDYLTGNHPNAHAVSRRFLRLFLLAVFCVVWWNLIVAPGLYGNRHASDSIREIVGGFDLAFDDAHKSARPSRYLTSRLIIPANVLERDGTRYFLFAPGKEDCPEIVRKPGDGATWRLYYVEGTRNEKKEPKIINCGDGTVPGDPEYLKKVVFASGSPFPVFPAHRVEKESLVDGGYSNNVPLDAAQTVSADMVLIVESSHPLGPEAAEAPPSLLRDFFYPGALIRSLPRLLSFLYERSQQIDRLSRSDLFVVSIAPPREELNWPFLVDFRPKTVNRMRVVAEQNLSRRIAMVQSWGRPHFQLTARLGPGAK